VIDEIKKDVEKLVEEELQRCIKTKGLFVDGHQAHGAIHLLKIYAINAACEAIQVAAMARKYQQSFRKEGKK